MDESRFINVSLELEWREEEVTRASRAWGIFISVVIAIPAFTFGMAMLSGLMLPLMLSVAATPIALVLAFVGAPLEIYLIRKKGQTFLEQRSGVFFAISMAAYLCAGAFLYVTFSSLAAD